MSIVILDLRVFILKCSNAASGCEYRNRMVTEVLFFFSHGHLYAVGLVAGDVLRIMPSLPLLDG